jgi:hypothetical protein
MVTRYTAYIITFANYANNGNSSISASMNMQIISFPANNKFSTAFFIMFDLSHLYYNINGISISTIILNTNSTNITIINSCFTNLTTNYFVLIKNSTLSS